MKWPTGLPVCTNALRGAVMRRCVGNIGHVLHGGYRSAGPAARHPGQRVHGERRVRGAWFACGNRPAMTPASSQRTQSQQGPEPPISLAHWVDRGGHGAGRRTVSTRST